MKLQLLMTQEANNRILEQEENYSHCEVCLENYWRGTKSWIISEHLQRNRELNDTFKHL